MHIYPLYRIVVVEEGSVEGDGADLPHGLVHRGEEPE